LNLNNSQKDFAEVDAFYATKSVTVEKGTTIIDFSLLRMGYGINFTVDALTSGNMEIYLGNDTIKLNSTKTTANTVRQFNKATNNFTDIHSKAETFGDSIAISAKWVGSNGTTVTASGKYKFLRNYQKTINIQLNTLTNSVTFEGWKIPTDGLVAWYPFNGNANDESGNGNNGTSNGIILTLDRFGNDNKSFYFDGINDYINLNIKLPNTFTTSFWVYLESFKTFVVAGPNYIGSKFISTFDGSIEKTGFEIALDGNSQKYGKHGPSFWNLISTPQQWIESSYTLSLQKWYLITSTFDGTTLKYYVNGTFDKSISASFIQNNKNISV